jgi:ribose 5-phosphate isomerase A
MSQAFDPSSILIMKQQAAQAAVEFVQSGMHLGLGSGSTTRIFVDLLGQRFQSGLYHDLTAVCTSQKTAGQASAYGIPLSNLTDHPVLDLAVDGADEVDPNLNLIKGLGRALLREKVVEIHARRFVVIVDERKLTDRLGALGPLPVEILPFESGSHIAWLNTLGCRAELLIEEGAPVMTDNGNYLAHCWFPGGISDPAALARLLADRPGILEHGLFLNMASQVIVAGPSGVRTLERRG